MIYLDNAATTLHKPQSVAKAIEAAMLSCANPGRSGHVPAMKAAEVVYQCREIAAAMFHAPAPENIVFTSNATHALNIAIKSVLHEGGHAVISGYEHNSVVRPLEAMREQGVCYTVAQSELFCPEKVLEAIRKSLRGDTRCVIINHISNVFGFVLPIKEIDSFCAQNGIALIVDASQSAGVLEIDASALRSACFICMPGHKSLYGPQGTGILVVCKNDRLCSVLQGGTGSESQNLHQPDFLPDALESGTLNVPGIAGLREGMLFVKERGICALAEYKRELVEQAAQGLSEISGVQVFYGPAACHQGLVSFKVKELSSAEVCTRLTQRGICLRDGLHCSPLAHRSAGTLPDGTCRISFSCFNTRREVSELVFAVKKVLTSA